ncbi:MAG: hypothetical protein GSR72_03970 [Desulfurococcales archaeon]|nr:hypothetical protein [Desulfurococcales archaeon]MEB3789031.1 hypothetical protein [Desulfurococcales archaeon]
MGKGYRVELTATAASTCTENPRVRLSNILLSMKSGDVVEIVGEETYYPYNKLVSILKGSGLVMRSESYDGLTYTVVAEKP